MNPTSRRPVQSTSSSNWTSPAAATERPSPIRSAPTPSNHFDLIRLLLGSAVMARHGFDLIDGNRSREPMAAWLCGRTLGEIAVIDFFVLSGHLIQSIWMRDPSASRFPQRRLARIAPAFVVCSLICAFCVAPFAADSATYWRQFRWAPYLASLVNRKRSINPDLEPEAVL